MVPRTLSTRKTASSGFTYILLLIQMALVAIALSVVVQVWMTMQMRAREEELLNVGQEFRQAIEQYYRNTPAGIAERYPRKLDDLLKDPRYPAPRRYLRKIYFDPITNSRDWGLQKAGDLITGVYSRSDREPIKKTEFRPVDQNFEGKTKYSEWIFTPRTGNRPNVVTPGDPGVPGVPLSPRAGYLQNSNSR